MPLPAWTEPLLPTLAPPVLRLLGATWRVELRGARHLGEEAAPRLYAVWHGRQLALTAALPAALRRGPLAVMTSASRDGRIQAAILTRLGLEPVTGSTSRHGDRALVQLARRVRAGASVVLAVDGPSGPVHCAKSGIGVLSRLTGAPMVPVGARSASPWIVPGTWDDFAVPRPGDAVEIRLGPPIAPPGPGHASLCRAMDKLQRRMAALNDTRPRSLQRAEAW